MVTNKPIREKGNNFISDIGADIIGSSYFYGYSMGKLYKKGDHLGRYKLETSTLRKYDLYKTPNVMRYR